MNVIFQKRVVCTKFDIYVFSPSQKQTTLNHIYY
jgi:hypothetical protein